MKKFNWAIIGTGTIGNEMAIALLAVNREIYAIYNRTPEKAKAFAKTYSVLHIYDDMETLLADEKIDIVYISTPHNLHYEYLKRSINAGKHVLCEKAITVNDKQLSEVRLLAKQKNVIVMEAMTLYHMPLYQKLKERIQEGCIGKVKMIQVNFGSCKEYDINNRFFSKDLAGGALLDIGVYAVSFARWFMSEKPNKILTTANFFETGVDEQSGIILSNDSGEMAVISLTMRSKQPKRGVISGEKGYMEIYDYPRANRATITYTDDNRVEEIYLGEKQDALIYEVRDMQKCLELNKRSEEYTYTFEVMDILTNIRHQWGFTYPFE